MPTIRATTGALGSLSVGYEASAAVNETLRQKELVPLIGPFAVGKTTLMRAAEAIDPAFGRIRSFTTRAQREGEEADAYDFLPHDAVTVAGIMRQARARELVQFTVHPTTGHVYGSTIGSYWAEYAMLDAMPTSLSGLVHLPFRAISLMAITVPPDEWEHRMAGRLRDGDPDDIRKRLSEGISNISWSLDQGPGLSWIVNGGRTAAESAREFIRVIRHGGETSRSARQIAAQLLRKLQELQAA